VGLHQPLELSSGCFHGPSGGGFGHGQRCSALRLLVLHEAIADNVIEMIQGAAAELSCGDPAFLATDVGPVIDAQAFAGITQHVQRLQTEAAQLLQPAAPGAACPHLLVPQAFEVAGIHSVRQEIFGPVLHVARWEAGDLSDPMVVIDAINQLGYGLTMGIQTRIDSRAAQLALAAHVGNVYVNRNTIGAVVGL
jgi:RHH-type proline utilization regulon transcriptional repressor/proline dehydrogenase/delta 1-pyrroline-5-carboxylate dehydrogenase